LEEVLARDMMKVGTLEALTALQDRRGPTP
jgi:hypothetical protein